MEAHRIYHIASIIPCTFIFSLIVTTGCKTFYSETLLDARYSPSRAEVVFQPVNDGSLENLLQCQVDV